MIGEYTVELGVDRHEVGPDFEVQIFLIFFDF